ncbi:amidohydrolase family protein [Umezawaea beigongshangensis]|uniref:amidohydrolase family protein n=1 Tax=Umezawaea beigongshangensis TaxID=2780383 RepID=UPI0018F21CD3|nr:amidohydrolase family protein [Umezawaea beigongshangensis]
MVEIGRRQLLRGVAGATVLLGTAPYAGAAEEGSSERVLPLREGTNLAARLSPDGASIAVDLFGVLWVLPAEGGRARRLTDDVFDAAQPSWAPDGRSLVFQSYRDGTFQLWTVPLDGSAPRQLTSGLFDHREPRFSPDGRRIACSSDRSGRYAVHLVDTATGEITALPGGAADEYDPAWSPDGRRIAFVSGGTRIEEVDVATGDRRTLATAPAGTTFRAPSWTPDGDDVLFTAAAPARSELWRTGGPVVTGEDVFPFPVSWRGTEFLYTADGRIRGRELAGGPAREIGFTAAVSVAPPRYRRRHRDVDSAAPRPVVGIGSPVLSPDGRRVAFRALNDLWTMTIGEPPRPLTGDTSWKCDPAWSPDGTRLSYSSDRGGTLDLWVRDLATGEDRQLTDLPDRAVLSASWSPTGTHLAFLDQTGALHTVEVATGAVRRVHAATFEPGRPSWSADGTTIALAAVVPFSARFREGLSKILLVDVATGASRYVDTLPGRSIQTRGDDGPVWSPDGTRMAFVVASVLQVVDVRPDGTPVGPPRQITEEVTDAPSWSGDSTRLLYLSNGRLRLVPAAGGRPVPVPVSLSWTTARPRGRTVVRAGRMWDGVAGELRHDVDVVVEGNRIAAVAPGGTRHDGRVVDARDSVVIPGLVDMHHHRELQGYAYGARQGRLWLSLGITTTRSPGSPAYHMVEERESIESGARLGPRYFATGEAIDGSRIYYNFMRPTHDERQLALELERAWALDYDLVKAYVRLPVTLHRRVVELAHRRGVPVTSHYHYPALAFGGDGMEHLGATNRLGYSRTVSPLGRAYGEVTDLFVRSGASLTPTFFVLQPLVARDDALAVDRRVRALYPPWEYASLQAYVAAARATDQTANQAILSAQVADALRVLRGGGTVVTGTDAPLTPTAISTHLNLRAMVDGGFTPHEALSTATRIPGEVLDRPLGRIAPGCYADLTLLGGDPLTDIAAAADVRQVMTDGELHTVDDLLAPYESTPVARTAPRNEVLPPLPDRWAEAGHWWHDPHWVESGRHACCADG